MGASLPKATDASHREQLADVRPRPAKADLSTQASASRVRDVAAEAIRSVCGNARAASIDLNTHEAHLSRLLKDGTFRLEQLEVLGPAVAVKFGELLIESFAPLATPKARARQQIKEIRQRLDELEQVVELIA